MFHIWNGMYRPVKTVPLKVHSHEIFTSVYKYSSGLAPGSFSNSSSSHPFWSIILLKAVEGDIFSLIIGIHLSAFAENL
jgi:hypothetical protein